MDVEIAIEACEVFTQGKKTRGQVRFSGGIGALSLRLCNEDSHRWFFLPEKGVDVMVRVTTAEVCSLDEIAVVHVMSRVVRHCFSFGTDDHTGKCYNHRRAWVETELKRLVAGFGIDEMIHPSRLNTKRVPEHLGRSI